MNTSSADPRGKHEPLSECIQPLRRAMRGSDAGCNRSRAFAFSARSGRLWARDKASNRHMLDDGFWRDVFAREVSVQAGARNTSAAPLDRPHRCTDAAAPESREASEPCLGLALLRPQPLTKKHRPMILMSENDFPVLTEEVALPLTEAEQREAADAYWREAIETARSEELQP